MRQVNLIQFVHIKSEKFLMFSSNKNCSLSLSSVSSCCTCRAVEVDASLLSFVLVVDKYFGIPGTIEKNGI